MFALLPARIQANDLQMPFRVPGNLSYSLWLTPFAGTFLSPLTVVTSSNLGLLDSLWDESYPKSMERKIAHVIPVGFPQAT